MRLLRRIRSHPAYRRLAGLSHGFMLIARHRLARAFPPPAAPPARPPLALDAAAFTRRTPLRQPTRTTCGSAVAVMWRLLHEQSYADRVLGGPAPQERFAAEALAAQRRTHGPRDRAGRPQLPWLRYYGTRSPALARELGGGLVRRFVDPRDPGRMYDALVAANGPVPLGIGDAFYTQHFVLVVEATPARLRIYDPHLGRVVTRTRRQFETARLGVAGWQQPWLALLPRGRAGSSGSTPSATAPPRC